MPKGSIRNPGTKTTKSAHDGIMPRAIRASMNKDSKWSKDFNAAQAKRIAKNKGKSK